MLITRLIEGAADGSHGADASGWRHGVIKLRVLANRAIRQIVVALPKVYRPPALRASGY